MKNSAPSSGKPESKSPPATVEAGVARPLWIGDVLLLVRRVKVGEREFVQGCWLDWPGIRTWLMENIADLLPEAELQPARSPLLDRHARMVASLPIQLVPGLVPGEVDPSLSPIRLSLCVAWICTLLAAVAVGVLMTGVVTLSERRGAFVSAVTHELRTPLTTFRMYTEMLSSGMVTEESKRQLYLRTLQTEADRLAHLVENVLAYARIERGRAPGRTEMVPLQEVLNRVEKRLRDRVEQGKMELCIEGSDEAGAVLARCDTAAVDQILFNLVDNACKYACQADDRRLHLRLETAGRWVTFSLRDHGPGITKDLRWRLFSPFSKSAQEAAHSAPGVGLGLALSRRLARDMRGDLRLEQPLPGGACFVLKLPAG